MFLANTFLRIHLKIYLLIFSQLSYQNIVVQDFYIRNTFMSLVNEFNLAWINVSIL